MWSKLRIFTIVLFSVLFQTSEAVSQTSSHPYVKKFAASIDIGTWYYINSISVNLERHLASASSGKINFFGRMGFGIVYILKSEEENEQLNGGLLSTTLLTGKGNHHFEFNGGVFLGIYAGDSNGKEGFRALPVASVAYRYQNPRGGLIFRTKMGILGIAIAVGHTF